MHKRFFADGLVALRSRGLFSFAFFYHLLNGVRHLVWDAGYGFERRHCAVQRLDRFLGSVALTAFFWFLSSTAHIGGAA